MMRSQFALMLRLDENRLMTKGDVMVSKQAIAIHLLLAVLGMIVLFHRPSLAAAEGPQEAAPIEARADVDVPPFWLTMFPKWTEPIEPFRVVGDVYYVGSRGLAVFFLPSDEGHILIDAGLPGQGRYIADQIEALGYDPSDIRYLINTHAHFDHSGGFSELKAITGADLLMSAADAVAAEQGVYLGSEEVRDYRMPPVSIDQIIEDGHTLTLGPWSLKAELTPGHSPGCTSWRFSVEEDGKPLDVLLFCSATIAANRLVSPPQYAGIIEAYQSTFDKARDWTPDVFLANHPEVFLMEDKVERLETEGHSVFIDRTSFPKYIEAKERLFQTALAQLDVKD